MVRQISSTGVSPEATSLNSSNMSSGYDPNEGAQGSAFDSEATSSKPLTAKEFASEMSQYRHLNASYLVSPSNGNSYNASYNSSGTHTYHSDTTAGNDYSATVTAHPPGQTTGIIADGAPVRVGVMDHRRHDGSAEDTGSLRTSDIAVTAEVAHIMPHMYRGENAMNPVTHPGLSTTVFTNKIEQPNVPQHLRMTHHAAHEAIVQVQSAVRSNKISPQKGQHEIERIAREEVRFDQEQGLVSSHAAIL